MLDRSTALRWKSSEPARAARVLSFRPGSTPARVVSRHGHICTCVGVISYFGAPYVGGGLPQQSSPDITDQVLASHSSNLQLMAGSLVLIAPFHSDGMDRGEWCSGVHGLS